MLKKFKYLDIIGKEVQFKIESNETYRTIVGGILTIVLGVVTMISLWFFGSDIIFKTNPNFLSNDLPLEHPEFFTLNNSNFFFAIRFTDFYGAFINEPRFLIPKFRYQYYEINDTTGELILTVDEAYEMTICNTSNIDEFTLHDDNLENYYCADLKNYTVGGDWNSDKLGYLFYTAELCSSATEQEKNITCATKQEIITRYNDLLYLDIKWYNSIINPSNYTNPVKRRLDYKYLRLDYQFRKENNFFYYNSEILTNDDLVLDNSIKESFFQLDSTTLDLGTISESIACELNIFFTKMKKEYQRSYIKVQYLAATVGGFFSLSFYVLKIIYYFYIEVHLQYFFYENLLNFRYDRSNEMQGSIKEDGPINVNEVQLMTVIPFEKHHESKSDSVSFKIKPKSQHFQQLQENTRKNIRKLHMNSNKNIESVESKRLSNLVSHNEKRREKYDITFADLVSYRYCLDCFSAREKENQKTKHQLIYSAEFEIEKKLDMLKVLQSFDQFKILKQILLNQNQCYMLDNKGKSRIYNKRISSKADFSKVIEEKKVQKDLELIKYLREKKENDEISEVDRLLFNLMDEELKMKINEEVNILN